MVSKNEIEKKVNNNSTRNMFTSIVAAVGILAAIIAPMQAEINSLRHELEKTETRSASRNESLDTKLQLELQAVDDRLEIELKDASILFDTKLSNLREVSELRLETHHALFGHDRLSNEVRQLWRYHEQQIGGK